MEFERVTPESVGISSADIMRFLDRLEYEGVEVRSMMLLRHGKVCCEGWWKPFTADRVHAMFSFSKSLTSTAVGFCVQEGLLKLDDKLADIFPEALPEHPQERALRFTVRDLLTMSCGHIGEILHRGKEGWMEDFFNTEFVYEPGELFAYNTCGTTMLAAAVQKVSGQHMTDFLTERLFDKIGIYDAEMEYQPDGYEWGGGGYRLTTEDMARFTQFVMNRGSWEGEQLLNREWFDEALSVQIPTHNEVYDPESIDWDIGYGYQFWNCQPENVVRADGLRGQYGIMMQDQDAILILTESTNRTPAALQAVWDIIVPAWKDESLPEAPVELALLNYRLEHATLNDLGTGFRSARDPLFHPDFCGIKYHCADDNIHTERLDDFELDDSTYGQTLWFTDDGTGDTASNLELHILNDGSDIENVMPIGMHGEFLYNRVDGCECASAGAWQSLRTLQVRTYGVNGIQGALFTFHFYDDRLEVFRDETPVADQDLRHIVFERMN